MAAGLHNQIQTAAPAVRYLPAHRAGSDVLNELRGELLAHVLPLPARGVTETAVCRCYPVSPTMGDKGYTWQGFCGAAGEKMSLAVGGCRSTRCADASPPPAT